MIGLDTNLLVRHIVRDDPQEAVIVDRLLREFGPERKGFINLIVLVELAWVLGRSYKLDRGDIAEAISNLLDSADIVIEREELVARALNAFRKSKVDLADLLINLINQAAGCETTATLDQQQRSLLTATVLQR